MQTKDKLEGYIPNNSIILGTINAENSSIRIDGEVRGDFIKADCVIVGKNGKIFSNILAKFVVVSGDFYGDIIALEKIDILQGAKVVGNISTLSLSISQGAIFNGNSNMLEDKEKLIKYMDEIYVNNEIIKK